MGRRRKSRPATSSVLPSSPTMVPNRNRSSTRSTIPSSPYDVFLSFRGEDTRLNFTDHLYSALNRRGIHTFRDDERLTRGESIQPSLLKAIEESKVSVVVFSENYAKSKWCLDELDKIMECMREKGQIVLPVFYHVDPSDVRKQTGSFGEAFAGYTNVAEERLQRWKAALREAGSLSGWHVEHGYESGIIHEIAQYTFNVLNCKNLHIDGHVVGMESRLEKMISLLHMESNDVRMIGIHGMAGIGKTTLAKQVCNKIADKFEHVSFLSGVSKSKDKHQLLHLQNQLLEDILGKNIPRISNIDEGINVIKRLFCPKKVLVVLDDVNDLNQLKSFVGEHQWFGPGSRIIITTRDKHLLDVHGVDGLYNVRQLKFEEAYKLFCWKAFKGNHPEEGFMDLAKRAVSYCAGLPLALEVLGSFLYGKTMLVWESELQKLQRATKMEIYDVLKRSLDGLDQTEKQSLLDIACFFNGEDINFFREVQDGCNFTESSMEVLYDRSLIHFSDNKIDMHDMIQKMGRETVMQQHPTQPGKWSRLWDPEDIHDVLTQNTGTKAIEGISFDMSASKETPFTTEAFKKMNRLRLLRIHWDELLSNGSNTVHLPKDFEFPSYELRYLHWDGWSLDSLPSSFNGEKLVKLSLRHSSLKHLWKKNKVKHLPKLRVMDLSHSQHLVECPDVSGAPSLETLNLSGCASLHEVHPSIAQLKNLKTLNLENCKMLQYFPRITGLESLEVLNLEATSIIELPSSVGYLQGLHSLNMRDCKSLSTLSVNIYALKSLKTLILSGCSELERFPEITEVMEHLENLLLDGTSIRELPHSIDRLKGLMLLNLRKCKDLRSLPNRICDLNSLETLIVSGCSRLNKLPEDLGKLQSLRNFQAGGSAITQPPTSLANLTNLEELSFSGCKGSTSNNLWGKHFPFRSWQKENSGNWIGLQLPSLSGLRFIKELDLSDSNLMEGTIDNKLCHLHALEVLNLSKNPIVSLPPDVSGLPNLRVLLVRQCEQLQKILKLSSSIKLLDACNCTSLKSLPGPSPMTRQQGLWSSISQQFRLSSTVLGPAKFLLWNCTRLPQDYVPRALEKLHQNFFPEIGYSIVIPGSRIPSWPWHESMGASVSADLPPHGLDDKFLGIVLCAVFSLEEGNTIQRPGEICCNFECREGPYFYHSINWTCGQDAVFERDHVWMIYQPRNQFMKSKSNSDNAFKHIKASFCLSGASHVVRKCAIRLIYAQNNVIRSRL